MFCARHLWPNPHSQMTICVWSQTGSGGRSEAASPGRFLRQLLCPRAGQLRSIRVWRSAYSNKEGDTCPAAALRHTRTPRNRPALGIDRSAGLIHYPKKVLGGTVMLCATTAIVMATARCTSNHSPHSQTVAYTPELVVPSSGSATTRWQRGHWLLCGGGGGGAGVVSRPLRFRLGVEAMNST